MIKQLTIAKRLFIGFSVLLFMFVSTNIFVASRVDSLTKFTNNLYKHPFAVSNAVLMIERDIMAMQHSMKDVVLAINDADFKRALNDVATYETSVYAQFRIIDERFLGDKNKSQLAEQTFRDWKPIRNEVVELLRLQKNTEAADITKSKGTTHIDLLAKHVHTLEEFAKEKAKEFIQNADNVKQTTYSWIFGIVFTVLIVCIGIAYFTTVSVAKPISEAVNDLQSMSAELETVARQQAAAAAEQTSSISELSSTAQELVATAKQIAANTQQVSDIAQQTVASGKSGTDSVNNAQTGMENTKKQVNLISQHMLDLGNKSQRIGVVLEIIDELSEQTNLLSLNATIEAAGAGDAGKRFAVVADEVRKLAERSAESTKEVKGLITDIQQTANTTIMVTEDGTKAVDEGVGQFHSVVARISEIVKNADSTLSSSREIEMTTRQQTSSVEQVSVALNQINTAAKQTEQSAQQTLESIKVLVDVTYALKALV